MEHTTVKQRNKYRAFLRRRIVELDARLATCGDDLQRRLLMRECDSATEQLEKLGPDEKNFWQRATGWLGESNRRQHAIYGALVGMVFSILAVLGCAAGMEFKDKSWGGQWDWLDFAATMLGGLFGQAVQVAVIWFLLNVQ